MSTHVTLPGRPASPTTPRVDSHVYVAVDLGGTQTRTAVFDHRGSMLVRRSVPTPRTGGPAVVIDTILGEVRSITEHQRLPVEAVGVSALGPVDPETGTIRSAPTLPDFDDVPLGRLLSRALDVPVHVHNDANAATVAEWRLGAGRGTEDFCYVTVSTGIGCGLISNGRLVTGHGGYAGEFGRLAVATPDGLTSLERLSSGTAIAARARALVAGGATTTLAGSASTAMTASTVAEAAVRGDQVARDVYRDAASSLGVQLANLCRLVDPECIAIGGGVTLAGPVFWDPLRESLSSSLDEDGIPVPGLVAAQLGGDAGLHGAALVLLGLYA